MKEKFDVEGIFLYCVFVVMGEGVEEFFVDV